MLVDTDILIWAMRGRDDVQNCLNSNEHKALSVISYMEMLQGVRNKREQHQFERYCKADNFRLLMVNEAISQYAMTLVKNYGLSHNMQMADALIAATAVWYDLPLLSANQKHYRFIEDLHLLPFTLEEKP